MAKMYDDPKDELLNPGHAEPDDDEMDLDSLMSGDIAGGEEEDLFPEDPLEQALASAGFENLDPEKLARVKAILTEKAAPAAGGKPGMPPAPGGAPAKPSPVGGAVPAGLPAGMGR